MAGECSTSTYPSKLGDHSYFAYLHITDIDSYYDSVSAKGARIGKSLRKEPWGLREFSADEEIAILQMLGEYQQQNPPAPMHVVKGCIAKMVTPFCKEF